MSPEQINLALRRAVDDSLRAACPADESWHAGRVIGYLVALNRSPHLLPILAQERYFAMHRSAALAVMHSTGTDVVERRRVAWASGMHLAWREATEGWDGAQTCKCGVRIVTTVEPLFVGCAHGAFCSQTCRSRVCDGTDDPADEALAGAA